MAVRVLPIDSDNAHSRRSVQLEGASYLINLDWNARDAAWYFSLRVDDGAATPLVEGFRVVVGGSPLRRVRHANRPPGDIVFVDTAQGYVDPGRYELGGRVIAIYFELAELQALVAAASA